MFILTTLMLTTLALKVLNFWKFTSYCSLKPLWSGVGEVVHFYIDHFNTGHFDIGLFNINITTSPLIT